MVALICFVLAVLASPEPDNGDIDETRFDSTAARNVAGRARPRRGTGGR